MRWFVPQAKERRLELVNKLAKLSPAARARVLKLAKIKRLKKAIEQELAARATRTLRTYPVGGDPVHDRIEFHLGKGPGGFRGPK